LFEDDDDYDADDLVEMISEGETPDDEDNGEE